MWFLSLVPRTPFNTVRWSGNETSGSSTTQIVSLEGGTSRCNSLETVWVEEVEKVEEFLEVVLKWGPCQKQLVLQVVRAQHSEELEARENKVILYHTHKLHMHLSILSPTLNVPDLYSSKVTTVSFPVFTCMCPVFTCTNKQPLLPLALPSLTTHSRFMSHKSINVRTCLSDNRTSTAKLNKHFPTPTHSLPSPSLPPPSPLPLPTHL